MGRRKTGTDAIETEDVPVRPGGRPRSEATRHAILTAALSLLEHDSIQSITMEAIARKAGVGKATIYRWWRSKASVIIDAFIENHVVHTPMRDDLHPAEALVDHWRLLARHYSGWAGRVVGQLLAEGQSDPEVRRELVERFYHQRRTVVYEVLAKLRATAPSLNLSGGDVLLDILYSSLYMKIMWGYGPIDDKFIREFPIEVFQMLGIQFDENGKFKTAA